MNKERTVINKAAEEKARERARILRRYDSRLLKVRTVADCEGVLRELAADPEILTTDYMSVYRALEKRCGEIKRRQEAIARETAAAIATAEKMMAHHRQ